MLQELSRAVLEVMRVDGLTRETPTGSYARCVLLKYGFGAEVLRRLAGYTESAKTEET
jgi:hypothetical protein